MEEPQDDGTSVRAAVRAGAADKTGVRAAFEEARQRFASLLEPASSSRPLLAAVFRQLETCLAAAEQLGERQRRRLRDRLAARWRHHSEAACRLRLAQLASRRRLLAEQQQQLDGLLAEARRQLQLAAAPAADLAGRLVRQWERLRERDGPAPEEAEGEQGESAAAGPPPALKPWLIEGLSPEEACDKRRLLERLRQLESETARLQEVRDTQYRPVTDYRHCLRRYFSCVEETKRHTNELMKVRAELRLHAAWVRDHHQYLGGQQQAPAPLADPMTASAELQHYDRQWREGREVETTAAGAGVGPAAATRSVPPLSERLLHSQLDAAESRALISESVERASWYEVEFGLAHGRLSLTGECVVALFAACRCRGRCGCQWPRLARAAQRRLPDRPPRTRGWAWRKIRMATRLIGLLHSTRAQR